MLIATGMLTACVLAGGAGTATAHPFGPPQVAQLTAKGSELTVTWSASNDDLFALRLHLEAVPESTTFVYQDGVAVPDDSVGEDAAFASLPEVESYFSEHVQVAQDGVACPGRPSEVAPGGNGDISLVFDCRKTVQQVDVTISTLTDVHPAYRTVARADSPADPDQQLYTDTTTSHRWTFGSAAQIGSATPEASRGRSDLGLAAGVTMALITGLALSIWSRARRGTRP